MLLEQAFVNVLDNAGKYAPAGSAIAVAAERVDDGIAFAIDDQGPGIPAADRERVFDLFYRVRKGDRQGKGTGLGLAISRGILEAHGGTIARCAGRGRHWHAHRDPSAAVGAGPASAKPLADRAGRQGMSGPTILVVDDEAQIRKFLRIALEAHGFEVREAATGRQGVAHAATDTPDLVILDLGLPDLDGKEVIRRIREWSGVPILILSVRQAEAEKVAALDAGANDYVVKPFGIAELLARVRALLRTGGRGTAQGRAGDDHRRRPHRRSGAPRSAPRREPVKLTRKEFELLSVLARNAGRILTHGQLLREVWGKAHENDTQYLRVFVSQLRRKLNDDPAHPRFILNEPGVGYRMLDTEI